MKSELRYPIEIQHQLDAIDAMLNTIDQNYLYSVSEYNATALTQQNIRIQKEIMTQLDIRDKLLQQRTEILCKSVPTLIITAESDEDIDIVRNLWLQQRDCNILRNY